MRYEPDLEKIQLDAYMVLLKPDNLLPSRRMLADDIGDRFARIQAQGAATVAQLLKALSSPAKIAAFAVQSGVDANYLNVLRREANTLKPKTVKLSDFPDTNPAEIAALAVRGMKTSKDYFEHGDQSTMLHTMCGLTRINGVGPNAAAMLCAAGCRSAEDIANADAETLLAGVSAANADHRYYAGTLGLKDIRFCIDYARLLLRFSS